MRRSRQGGKAKRLRRQWRQKGENASSYADRFLADLFPPSFQNNALRTAQHMGSVLQRHGWAKPWCCRLHQDGGDPHAYCDGIGQLRRPGKSVRNELLVEELRKQRVGLHNVVFDEMERYPGMLGPEDMLGPDIIVPREEPQSRPDGYPAEPWCPASPLQECTPSMDDEQVCAGCDGPMPQEPPSAAEKNSGHEGGCDCDPFGDSFECTPDCQFPCPGCRKGG